MISELITLISLQLTANLVAAGQVAQTMVVTGATATTPIRLTIANHGIPAGRVGHGVVSGVGGTVEADGLWVLSPVDASTLALSTYTPGGLPSPSVGVHAYTSGGQVQFAFPDWGILLGRRNVALASAVASPRIVFVPTDGRKWGFEPYGGLGPAPPQQRGTTEQQAERLNPQIQTQYSTFEVFVTGCASPPSPDFGDIDAAQTLAQALYAAMADEISPARVSVLHESWPSQSLDAGTQTQRGAQWKGIVEVQQPVTRLPLQFVPVGTSLVMVVEPVNPLVPADQTTITIPPGVG